MISVCMTSAPVIPSYIILDLGMQIKEFCEITDYLNIPAIDITECLDDIFYTIIIADDQEFISMVEKSIYWLCEGKGLNNDVRLDPYEVNLLHKAVIKLAEQVKSELFRLNAYIDGMFPYELHQILNRSLIVLMYNPDHNDDVNVFD